MSGVNLSHLWLSQLFESEQILPVSEIYLDNKNVEISTIIIADVTIEEAEKDFLTKILQACGIQSDRYLILNSLVSYKSIKNSFPSLSSIFLFNIDIRKFGVNFRIAQLESCKVDNVNFIACPPLAQIASDNNLKSYFWNSLLKPIFVPK